MKKYLFLVLLFFLATPLIAQDLVPDLVADPEPGLNLWMIVSGVLAVISSIFGVQLKKVKAKIKDVVAFGKESLDVLFVGSAALEDNVIDKDEVAALKKEIAEAKTAWYKIWEK